MKENWGKILDKEQTSTSVLHFKFHHVVNCRSLLSLLDKKTSIKSAANEYINDIVNSMLKEYEDAENLIKVVDTILKILDQSKCDKKQFEKIILYIKLASQHALDSYEEVEDWQKWGDDIFYVEAAIFDADANDQNIRKLLKLLADQNIYEYRIFASLVAKLIDVFYIYSDFSVYQTTTSSTHGSLFKRTTKILLNNMSSLNNFESYLIKLRNKMIFGINYTEDLLGKQPRKRSRGVRSFTKDSVSTSAKLLQMFKKDQSGMLLFSFEPDGFCSACAGGETEFGDHCVEADEDDPWNMDEFYRLGFIKALKSHSDLIEVQIIKKIKLVRNKSGKVIKIFVPVQIFNSRNVDFINKVIDIGQLEYTNQSKLRLKQPKTN